MMISTRGRYALRVLIDMAEHPSAGKIPLRDIAERQEISEKYLESIVKDLVKAGIIEGLRGKGGGYQLNKAADQINVYDVISLMEGTLAPVTCLEADKTPCMRMSDCRTISLWKGLDEAVRSYLSSYTIADLMHRESDGFDYVI
ncbi:MAG: Rrf2 family transcriptional regulator [Oscillospiraceae bacterium]|nr:Rrf2 family transcriptional regulator [Oscillospiraceae bacterium]